MEATKSPFRVERLGIIMRPDLNRPEEVEGVLNPAAARGPNGELYLFPRCVGKGNFSRIGIARVIFNDEGNPVDVERLGFALEPREPYELRPADGTGGCEDPRVTYIAELKTYVMAFAAWGPDGPRLSAAISKDCLTWERLGLINYGYDEALGVDFNKYDNKDGVFGPNVFERPDGTSCIGFIHRPAYTSVETAPHGTKKYLPSIWISHSDANKVLENINAITEVDGHILGIDPENDWEQLRIGAGTPPIHTHLGMMMIYHGVAGHLAVNAEDHNVVNYTAGVVFFEPGRGGGLKYRSSMPIFIPETPDETTGVVNNVVFPTGVDDRGNGIVDFYYGMADRYVGAARLYLPETLPH